MEDTCCAHSGLVSNVGTFGTSLECLVAASSVGSKDILILRSTWNGLLGALAEVKDVGR